MTNERLVGELRLRGDRMSHRAADAIEAGVARIKELEAEIASVERAAAEKAWDRCVGEMPIDPDWKNFYSDNNPYRAEAYRQERGE